MPQKFLYSAAICFVFIYVMGAPCLAETASSSSTQSAVHDPLQIRFTPELKIQGISLPVSWKAETVKNADTHISAEWQAASGQTVFGAVYIHLPPFMGGEFLVESVKKNYVKRQPGGKITNEWTDASERHWFEVDAASTHTKGFVVTHGHHGWFVYYRYGTAGQSPQSEIDAADHAINQVTPIVQ